MTGTRTLIFETSTPHASLAMSGVDGIIDQREFTGDRSHNATLFAPLKELLDADKMDKIGLVLVGSGPGSYSGTRVGIAAAQGVAMASLCPAVAVPSILAVPSARDGASCLAIGDARRGSYWFAKIQGSTLLGPPELTDAEGLATVVKEALSANFTVFSFEDPSRFPLTSETGLRVKHEYPDASRLWQAWCDAPEEEKQKWMQEAPQPMYLKPPHITPAKRPWLVRPQS